MPFLFSAFKKKDSIRYGCMHKKHEAKLKKGDEIAEPHVYMFFYVLGRYIKLSTATITYTSGENNSNKKNYKFNWCTSRPFFRRTERSENICVDTKAPVNG